MSSKSWKETDNTWTSAQGRLTLHLHQSNKASSVSLRADFTGWQVASLQKLIFFYAWGASVTQSTERAHVNWFLIHYSMGTRIQKSVRSDATVAVADVVTKYTLSFISLLRGSCL